VEGRQELPWEILEGKDHSVPSDEEGATMILVGDGGSYHWQRRELLGEPSAEGTAIEAESTAVTIIMAQRERIERAGDNRVE
jgi:hypothetical protein